MAHSNRATNRHRVSIRELLKCALFPGESQPCTGVHSLAIKSTLTPLTQPAFARHNPQSNTGQPAQYEMYVALPWGQRGGGTLRRPAVTVHGPEEALLAKTLCLLSLGPQ